ncbi:MAG: hypothetical protein NTX72_03815 [Candidatus Uhrbacteria bacterium]|nr:hypothetical protein [Candidatus Uhrbacteria bacterium]
MNRLTKALLIVGCVYVSACSDSTIVSAPPEVAGDVSMDSGSPDLPPDVPQDTGPEIAADVFVCVTHEQCDTKTPCQQDWCDPGTGECHHQPSPQGTACSDGDVCTTGDVCSAIGTCVGPKGVDCSDGKPCTLDPCDKIAGCSHVNIDIPCDDGSVCTNNDHCLNGNCLGKAVDCDDADQCTKDYCNEINQCVHEKLTNDPCDDGNACTAPDQCAKGACAGTPITCNDGNACTADLCDKVAGCYSTPQADGANCNDGDFCTQNDTCQKSQCVSGNQKNCNDNNVCTADSCDSGTGVCVHTPIPNVFSCSDNSLCTTDDQCSLGVCIGKQKQCADGNDCTEDSCIAATGCQFTVHDKDPCNDNNACTIGDICYGNNCKGLSQTCNDNNVCTNDSCDPAIGVCNHTANQGYSCDDGDACTLASECSATTCVGKVYKCDDGNSCTDDICNPKTGCIFTNVNNDPCDDGDACTTGDKCNNSVCISKPPLVCDDQNKCTSDSCNPTTGKCVFVPIGNCVP